MGSDGVAAKEQTPQDSLWASGLLGVRVGTISMDFTPGDHATALQNSLALFDFAYGDQSHIGDLEGLPQ
jgi:hypothetical protein